MLPQLPPRERQIVDLLYEEGPRTVAEICSALPDPLSGSAVRAMLKRLEDKGFVRRENSDRGYVYSPTVSDNQAQRTVLSQIVRTFFKGSPVSAASALLGMAQDLDTRELDELEAAILRARQAREGGK
jgi:predicted transcriptional regulator